MHREQRRVAKTDRSDSSALGRGRLGWIPGVMLGVLLLVPAAQAAPDFSALYVFGDSLSDMGNTAIMAPDGLPDTTYTYGSTGRFSNGPVWTDYLADRLGLDLAPSRTGGNNYAHGGAEFDAQDSHRAGLLLQYQYWLEDTGGADPDALYVIWAGANDLRAVLQPGVDPAALIAERMGAFQTMLGGLIANGAQQLLIPTAPNLALTPEAIGYGAAEQIGMLVQGWNAALAQMLDQVVAATGVTIWHYDVYGLMNELYADPAAFGFTNLTEPCSQFADGVEIATCANPDQYLYWDTLHPTTAGHSIIADRAWEILDQPTEVPTPASLWLLLPGVIGVALLRGRKTGQEV